MTKRNLVLAAVLMCASISPRLVADCTWVQAPASVPFGVYSVFSPTNLTTTTQIRFNCAGGQTARITITRGSAPTFNPRTMRNGAEVANYNLYRDAGYTQIWGDLSGGTIFTQTNNTGGNVTYTAFIYGMMPAAQDLLAVNYSDTVIVTLSWTTGGSGCQGQCQNDTGGLAPINVAVSSTITPECRVNAFALGFGTYDPLQVTATNASTKLNIYCTRNTSIASAVLNNGAWWSGTSRRMSASPTAFLDYGATLVLPGSLQSTSSLTPIGNGFDINGTVPASQDVAVGSYIDSLLATINY